MYIYAQSTYKAINLLNCCKLADEFNKMHLYNYLYDCQWIVELT